MISNIKRTKDKKTRQRQLPQNLSQNIQEKSEYLHSPTLTVHSTDIDGVLDCIRHIIAAPPHSNSLPNDTPSSCAGAASFRSTSPMIKERGARTDAICVAYHAHQDHRHARANIPHTTSHVIGISGLPDSVCTTHNQMSHSLRTYTYTLRLSAHKLNGLYLLRKRSGLTTRLSATACCRPRTAATLVVGRRTQQKVDHLLVPEKYTTRL